MVAIRKTQGVPEEIGSVLLTVSLLAFLALPASAKEPFRTIEGIVTKVSDGDTIQVTDSLGTRVKVRFYGIDCPETEKGNRKTGRVSKAGQPYGEEAYRALESKVDRQMVRLEVMALDRYGRTVGIVWLMERNINLEMVTDGWAWAYTQYLDRPHASEYIQAEELAHKAHRGLWQQGNPQPPWEFRKLQRKGSQG